ncbi:MAG: phosphopyruvate hydratase [Rhizobiaceae bacterium]|nr:phosphopyruvate hydratase [Rhizobiaceae bacterium]
MSMKIEAVAGRRVWDSRGRPTIEVDVTLAGGARGRAIAPAGASTGSGEAVDLRDGGAAQGGMDVTKALAGLRDEIAPALLGMNAEDQSAIDGRMTALDGTPNKSRLGGNAIIATSMAVAHAAAAGGRKPLWKYLAGDGRPGTLPLPEIQIFGGGAHAGRRIDIQDLMVVAVGAPDFATALDWTADVYRAAGKLLGEQGKLAGVADEGGFWPVFDSNEEALSTLLQAIERSGHRPGEDVAISLDIAASEFGRDGTYRLDRENRSLDRAGMADMLLDWVKKYPIVSIEDPLGEDDEEGLIAFTQAAGPGLQIIGDDFLVTNADRVRHAASVGACNAILIKPNQAGTLTETKAALNAAKDAGYSAVVSARSGETEDVTIVHLAVGWNVPQLKVGSFTRSERMAKWNEGLRVGEELPTGGTLPLRASLPWGRG